MIIFNIMYLYVVYLTTPSVLQTMEDNITVDVKERVNRIDYFCKRSKNNLF